MALFKDFRKDVKDLLTKNYTDAGTWKLESKFKGPKDTVFINPQAGPKGVALDVEYTLSACPTKLKLNLTPACDAKLTATYDEKGQKAEVVVEKTGAFEAVLEGKVATASINTKFTAKAAEFGVAVPTISNLALGAGATYAFAGSAVNWTAGARWSDSRFTLSVLTAGLKTYTTSLLVPVAIQGFKETLAAEVECGGGNFKWTVGADMACILCNKNTLRLRVDNNFKWALAYVAKFADGWKAAVTVDAALKPGLTLTHE